MRPGDLLVITSDGIDENHLEGLDFATPALTIAEQILHSHAKDNDDALVLTARHRGVSG
jgi:negative regulator of sigma-B (phosphoserine phosphatase)